AVRATLRQRPLHCHAAPRRRLPVAADTPADLYDARGIDPASMFDAQVCGQEWDILQTDRHGPTRRAAAGRELDEVSRPGFRVEGVVMREAALIQRQRPGRLRADGHR